MPDTPTKKNAAKRALPSLGEALRHHVPMAVLVLVAGAIVAGVAVLPMRTWLEQRELLTETERQHQQILGEVDRLESELERLQTDEEIERLSREHFDFVRPGEESYRILPPSGG